MKKIFILTLIFSIIITATVSAAPVYHKPRGIRIGQGMGEGTAIMYHQISENKDEWSDYCVSPGTLENDIKEMLKKGYIFIRPKDIYTLADAKEKYVMLTFDDGYESDYDYVYPLLMKYKVPATFFIAGIYVDKPNYLTSAQITEMSKNEFVEFGNHSYELHQKTAMELKEIYANINKMTYVLKDFEQTETLILSLTGKKTVALSYPYGIYTNTLENNIKAKFNQIITFSTHYGRLIFPYIGMPINRINRANSFDINVVNQ